MSLGLERARAQAKERIAAGRADREAGQRYRGLATSGRVSAAVAKDYLQRAEECERLAKLKLTGKV